VETEAEKNDVIVGRETFTMLLFIGTIMVPKAIEKSINHFFEYGWFNMAPLIFKFFQCILIP